MRAVCITGTGDAEDVFDVVSQRPLPTPQASQLLLKVHFAGFNHLDTKIRKGYMPAPPILGLECSGVVQESLNPDYQVGEEICGISWPTMGTYAEFVALDPADQVARVPVNLSLQQAASLPVGLLTGFAMFQQHASLLNATVTEEQEKVIIADGAGEDLFRNKTIVVVGCTGPVGLCTVLLSKFRFGAERIIGVCSQRNSQLALDSGCDEILDYTSATFRQDVLSSFQSNAPEAVLDCFGGYENMEFYQSIRSENEGEWSYLVCGVPDGVNPGEFRSRLMSYPRSALCAMRTVDGKELGPLLAMVAESGIEIPVVEFELSQAAEAHVRYEENRPSGKIVLKI